jgi:hypothetical protein
MKETGMHPGMELRVRALATRIAELKDKMHRATGIEWVEGVGELGELERRHKALDEQLSSLDREGPGFRQDVEAELETVVADLSGSIADFMARLDSRYRAERDQAHGGGS